MKKLLNLLSEQFFSFLTPAALIFVVLYPKLPSIYITHTWVYVRLEDFVITFLAIIWSVSLLRRKIKLPLPLGYSIILYWVIGLLSLTFSLIFIAPHLANFFSKIAILNYVRRIEYMGLFFISFATVKKPTDVKKYIVALGVILTGIIIYGFGQRWYLIFWQLFPKFFEKFPFCFPSFQTGNEEFAKGIPLCLPGDARITSTFGGHYDLAGFLVIVIPISIALAFSVKNVFGKIMAFLLSLCSIILLIFTASRVSYIAYIVGLITVLVLINKKKFILPAIIISIGLLGVFSSGTAKRFMQTFRFASIVTTTQGTVVGVAQTSLPKDLQKKISKNPVVVQAPPPTQNLPAGSGFITLPQAEPKKTSVAVVQSSLSKDNTTLKKLKFANGGYQLSTISGSFLIQKALVYDISFTTRFQAEWPAAWRAFLRNPLLGSGYSSITLATDGDYHRLLGETGILGFVSFAIIFMCLGILLYVGGKKVIEPIPRAYVFGVAAGCIGLFFNALFIDVFEASKIAEPLWIILGVSAALVLSVYREKIPYFHYLLKVFTSKLFLAFYLYILLVVVFFGSISSYFVADDFTWLRWAASSGLNDIPNYFTHAQGFFYRPVDKVIMFGLYTFFSFLSQEGYHIFILTIHFLVALGVFLLLYKVIKNKLWSFTGSVLFMVFPVHAENVYWISSLSIDFSALCVVYAVISWYWFREKVNIFAYALSIICLTLGLFSYEGTIITPLLFIATDIYLGVLALRRQTLFGYLGVIVFFSFFLWARMYSGALGPNGDYSINASHVVPNSIGNLVGYIGVFFGGESFLPIYAKMRLSFKQFALPLTFIIIALIAVLTIIYKIYGKKIVLKRNSILYGLVFGIISLVPFLGLGNLSTRYIYLASTGWIITLIYILYSVESRLHRKLSFILYIIIIGVIFIEAVSIQKASYQWERAGEITNNTLQVLRQEYPRLDHDYRLIFVNVPIKFDNAWVFPVGLSDGIWFIYRDDTIKIYQVKDFSSAKDIIRTNASNATRFYFDSYGSLSQVD